MKLFAKKSLGQHFLNSTHVLEQIISAAKIQKGEQVLEIGPGTGVLTRALIAAGANVIAIEKDQRAVVMLEQDFFTEIKNGQLKIISGDVLDGDTLFFIPAKAGIQNDKLGNNKDSAQLQIQVSQNLNDSTESSVLDPCLRRDDTQSILSNSSFALVANIPYYITGAILEKFLEHEPRPNRMVLLVQKEVAERICSRDGKESILSVSVKAFGTPKIIAKVPPGAFTPPPTVDSAIISIENISAKIFSTTTSATNPATSTEPSKNVDIDRFFRIVKAGFAHKRKFVTRNLETVLDKDEIETIWKKLGLDEKIRAEDMTVEHWVKIVFAI